MIKKTKISAWHLLIIRVTFLLKIMNERNGYDGTKHEQVSSESRCQVKIGLSYRVEHSWAIQLNTYFVSRLIRVDPLSFGLEPSKAVSASLQQNEGGTAVLRPSLPYL